MEIFPSSDCADQSVLTGFTWFVVESHLISLTPRGSMQFSTLQVPRWLRFTLICTRFHQPLRVRCNLQLLNRLSALRFDRLNLATYITYPGKDTHVNKDTTNTRLTTAKPASLYEHQNRSTAEYYLKPAYPYQHSLEKPYERYTLPGQKTNQQNSKNFSGNSKTSRKNFSHLPPSTTCLKKLKRDTERLSLS